VTDTTTAPPVAPPSTAELERRIAQLEAENARLAAAGAGDGTRDVKKSRPDGGRWRAFVSALCIVIAAILVPVSIVSVWARTQLVDEQTFVATLAPLAKDVHVQNLVISEAMDAIDAKVDFNQITGNVIDGISGLGLGPRATDALKLLQKPAADGLHNLVQTGITKVVQSDQFADVWATSVRGAHRALVTTATSDGNGAFVLSDQGLGLRLGPIVDQVKQKLVANGVGAASLIPAVDKTIIIGDGSAVGTIRTVYAIADFAGLWLPFVTLALFAAGILIARRRSTAVLGVGLAFLLSGAILAGAFSAGDIAVNSAATALKVSPSALDVIYTTLIDDMQRTALVIALLGGLVAVLGWVTGRWGPARRIRGLFGGLNASARTSLAARGLDTGRFGLWMGRQRVLVRTIVVVLAVIWLVLLRPLSAGDVFLVLIVALLVTWVLELLQKRPDDLERAAAARVAEDESLGEQSAVPVPAMAGAGSPDAEFVTPMVETTPAAATTAESGARDAAATGELPAPPDTATDAGSSTPAKPRPARKPSAKSRVSTTAEGGAPAADGGTTSGDADADTAVIPDADATDTAVIPDVPDAGTTK
jgi:hypothetical protein